MEKRLDKYKPAVGIHILLLFAGGMWMTVGTILLTFSYSWLRRYPGKGAFVFAGAGIASALIISRFGFLKIVNKNVRRILPMEGKRCAFSFMSWKSYLLVLVMVAMVSHSAIPRFLSPICPSSIRE